MLHGAEFEDQQNEPGHDAELVVGHGGLGDHGDVGGHEPASEAHEDLGHHHLERGGVRSAVFQHEAQAGDADAAAGDAHVLVAPGVRGQRAGQDAEDDQTRRLGVEEVGRVDRTPAVGDFDPLERGRHGHGHGELVDDVTKVLIY